MLKNLYIQNYAIIEELNMAFGPQLNIITGETGAGKSILTGALGLIQGNRADTKVLYDEQKKCIVEAEFEQDSSLIADLFAKQEMEYENPIIVRRMIAPNGKSRAFVNDEPVKLSFLKELSAHLVDMHRQFDTLGISEENTQKSMLDSLAGNQDKITAFQEQYKSYKKDQQELNSLIAEEQKVKQELDFLQFQFSELDEAAFLENEQQELEDQVNVLENADSIISILQKMYFQIDEVDGSISSQLSDLRNELERLGDVGTQVEELLERLINVEEEIRDIAFQSNSISGNLESDPKLLEEKQERQNLLYRLMQKHSKENLAELLVYQEELHSKIKHINSFEHNRGNLESKVKAAEEELKSKGKKISASRQKAIPEFEKKIKQLLAELGMEHAQFKIDLLANQQLSSNGTDTIQFLFSANPGKKPQPIGEVASGGELSRLALSLKSIVAGNIELGTLIFDEIDTGISGEVSAKMGIILKKLASKHQLISITHSPQIASKADSHFFIYKVVENQRTYTKVKLLDPESRIQEIAKMLSGDPPSAGAMENAKELIN